VRQAEASLAGAQARLQQLLAGPRPEEVAQAEQAVRLAQAELDLAQREFERSEQLFKEGLVARQQLDQAEARLRSARAQHQSATERLNQVRSGPTAEQIAEARAAARQAEAALEQARARSLEDPVREQEIAAARAQVTLARSSLFNVEQRLAETVIRAPVSGVVARRSVEVGQSVIGGSVGATVLTLAVDQPLLAKVMVDEGDVARVRPGLRVEIRAEGLPDDRFTGRTLAVSPNAQTVSNVVQYEVTVQVEDPQRLLRLGMSVDAEFIVTSRAGVLLIPKEALRGETTKAVFVVEGEKLTPRLVQVGGTDGRMVEIRSGLQGSEIVYLGEARRQAEERQQRNPFAPDFRRRPTPGGR
jgi:HlyD family secretion protein